MPLQNVWPAGHSQFPPAQIKPSAQALPHVPQFFGSAWRLRHDPLQLVRPPPHWVVHTPLLHTWFSPQPTLQEPHRLGLDDKFAQVPVQSVSPAGHWQLPAQTLPPVQAMPQAPQWEESVAMSTHTPPQSVFPCGHWQVPLQILPPVHAVPQIPQLAGSVAVSTQLPLHSVVPVGH
jgi:hypothetical protein